MEGGVHIAFPSVPSRYPNLGRGGQLCSIYEDLCRIKPEFLIDITLGTYLCHRYTAEQMRPDILRLRFRCIVHIAPDIEVEVVCLYLSKVNEAGVFRNLKLVCKDMIHLLNILRPEHILVFPLCILP